MKLDKLQFGMPLIALCYVGAILLWEHFNGGIQSHHFLARKDMPAVSNVWGLVVMPLVAWFCAKALQRRFGRTYPDGQVPQAFLRKTGWLFFASALYGAAIVIAFLSGYDEVSGILFPALFIIGLFLPLYHAEYYLGFVVALCPAFGAVLPIVVGGVVAAFSFVFRGYLFPMLKKVIK
jgi:hypothetical protein